METFYKYCEQKQEYKAIECLEKLDITGEDDATDILSDVVYIDDCAVIMAYLMKKTGVIPHIGDIARENAIKCATVLLCSDQKIYWDSFNDYVESTKMVKFAVDQGGQDPNSYLYLEDCDRERLDFLMERGADDKDDIGSIAAKLGDEKLAREMLDKGADKNVVLEGAVMGPLHSLVFDLIDDKNKQGVAVEAARNGKYCVVHYLIDNVEAKDVTLAAAKFGDKKILDLCLPYYDDYAVLHSVASKGIKDYLYSLYKE